MVRVVVTALLAFFSDAHSAHALGSACSSAANGTAASGAPYWLGSLKAQGSAPFAPSGYQVRRNVKDFGAKGDGSTDDTAAIK